MKTAAIISCNDNYDYDTRTKYVCNYLEAKGYNVTFVVADFDHRNKKKYRAAHTDTIKYIKVPTYKKNLSVRRIVSHFVFAHKVASYISKEAFDLVYHCAPPNSTIRTLSSVKKHQDFTLITEIGDMWPETMPISSKLKKILKIPFCVWSGLRDRYLYNSNIIISECDLFADKIRKNTKLDSISTMHFCKQAQFINASITEYSKEKLNLCYLGSINNIIDLNVIGKLVSALSRSIEVDVHIIGDGEKKDELISIISKAGGNPIFYGKIFDEKKKREIFSSCHYALNVMKSDVFVGMTMKSLDYFSYGLPMINNIGADIGNMVANNDIGFNINESNIEDVAKLIFTTSAEEYITMRQEVKRLHEKYFSIESFYRKMESFKIEGLR